MKNLGSFIIVLLVIFGCQREDDPDSSSDPALTVTTTRVSEITNTTAICGGIILSDGGSPVLSKGVCWSESPTPTQADHIVSDTIPSDSIIGTLTGLMMYTKYYARPFATNSLGTVYGEELSFTTQGGIVTDRDGHVYHTISIGSQVWMAENLRTTKFNNGDSIPYVTDNQLWETSPGAFCYYNNKPDFKNVYGGLYNWVTVYDSRQLAPEGWHIPTEAEWDILASYTSEGGCLKEKGTTHWLSPNSNATNESGFAALPGGCREPLGSFVDLQSKGYFWSSSLHVNILDNTVSASCLILSYDKSWIGKNAVSLGYGFSVRCVKD